MPDPDRLIAYLMILSLGLDTLITSASLGLVQRSRRTVLNIAVIFAATESLLPLIGYFLGREWSRQFAASAPYISAFLFIGLAVYFIYLEQDEEMKWGQARDLTIPAIALTAFSAGMDEVASGFAIGWLQAPLWLTIALMAVQAVVFVLAGLTFGAKIRPFLGEWAEKATGAALGLFGIWLLIEEWFL